MRLTTGIRTQLIAGIIVTTIAGIGIIGVLSIKIIENNALKNRLNEAEMIVRAIRTTGTGEVERVVSLLRAMDIDDFVIKDARGGIVTQQGTLPKDRGEPLFLDEDIKVYRVDGGGWFGGPARMFYVSAFHGDGTEVSFTISLADLRRELWRVTGFLLLYALIDSVIIIGIGVYFLSKGIVKPIDRLRSTATRIAGGRLGERVDVEVDNEIGSLARSFNIMAERLEEEIKRLERVNKELLSTQEELLRSSTLAAMGRLAAGLAHEIGNPLGAVQGYLDILLKGVGDREEEREILRRTEKEISRINTILREFLDIARPSTKTSQPVDVNRLVEETVSIVSVHRAFKDRRLDISLERNIPRVVIDEGKLRQVFINLLLNAAEAVEGMDGERKVVTIRTGREERTRRDTHRGRRRDDPVFTFPEAQVKEEYVFVEFSDRGCGIPEGETLRIFDPFYTTKGHGTGLGLFVSQSIIKTYGGEIEVRSREGEGTTFRVVLPASTTKPSQGEGGR